MAKTAKVEGKVLAAVAYLLTILTGIVVYLISKEKFDRFHAVQAIFLGLVFIAISYGLGIVGIVLALIPVIGWIGSVCIFIATVLMLPAAIVIVLFAAWKAYNGETYKFPYIGDLAEKYS